MTDFEDYLSHSLDGVNQGIVKEAALYALMNGGKRIRPKLLFAVLEAYHTNIEKGYDAACAVEMMHSYSLIHDDLPSMDNDTIRRGKPTCHVKYGEGIAILAGDALLTHSFQKACNATKEVHVNLKIVNDLSTAGGLDGMIYGQELDIQNENRTDITADKLQEIHFYKTGKLITLPMVLAAHIAKKEDDVNLWREIGKRMGILFQIQDDVFDVTKTTEELGKNANSDKDNNKITYVSLLGIEECNKLIASLYHEAVSMLDQMVIDKEPILNIFNYLLNREK